MKNSSDSTQSDKYKNGGFLHAVTQVIALLNLDNTPIFVYGSSSTPHTGSSVSDRFGTSGGGICRFFTSGSSCPCQQPRCINQLYHTDYQQLDDYQQHDYQQHVIDSLWIDDPDSI